MRNLSVFMLMGALCAVSVKATTINLGTAENFAVLAGQTVTNTLTGATIITGNVGVSPGTAVTNFALTNTYAPSVLGTHTSGGTTPAIVSGTVYLADTAGVAERAQADLTTAYLAAAAMPCTGTGLLTGQDLGGLTLTPGVYCFSSSAQLTGTLTLDAQSDSNAFFLFQMGSMLTTASNSSVLFTNDFQSDSLFWQVGSSATLGTSTAFAGNILALTKITLNTGATISCGRALARNDAVTLDSNIISIESDSCKSDDDSVPAPEIGTLHLLSFSLGCCGLAFLRSKRQ